MAAIDKRIAKLARLRGGLVVRDELLLIGVSDEFIQERLRVGLWQPIQSGVYLVGAAAPTWAQRLRGACLVGAGFVFASHRAGAFLHGFDGALQGPIEVVVVDGHRFRPSGAIVHYIDDLRLEDQDVVDGTPTTGVIRTLVDYASVVPLVLAERGLESMVRRGKTSEDAVRAWLDRYGGRGRRGVGKLRRVLDGRLPGGAAGSPLEVFAAHLDAANAPGLVRQYPVEFFDGEVVLLDWAFPDVKYNVEWDGDEFHTNRRASRRDLQRDKTLRALGWTVRRFPYADVKKRPAWVASEILAALAALRAKTHPSPFF